MRVVPFAVAAVLFLGAGAARGDPAGDYEALVQSDGADYAKRRDAFLKGDRKVVGALLQQRRDKAKTDAEKRLAEALLARLHLPDEVARLEVVFREASRRCAGICLAGWHVVPRPDPEITGDGMWLLFAGEAVANTGPREYPAVEIWEPKVRLPKSPLWIPILSEIVLKGWTATDEPTPEPVPFDRMPKWYIGGASPRFAGPRAPNGDLYVFYAIELLGRRGERAVVAPAIEYVKTHAGYPERQYRATIALRRLGDKTAVPALLSLAREENLYQRTRVEAFRALAELGDRSVVKALRPLLDEKDPEDATIPSPWALHAQRTIRAIEAKAKGK